jgi:F-type H+-transporting ATPase subunit epsilon
MANTLQFDLVSPERRLVSAEATEVLIPGTEGDLTAMAGHAPLITTLRPGLLRAVTSQGVSSYIVTGGFAEIGQSGVSVLAERAIPIEEATGTVVDELVDEARSLASIALPEDKAAAEKTVNDLLTMKSLIIAHH